MNSPFHERQLESLRSIRPDPVFLKWSKKAILESAAPGKRRLVRRISLEAVLSRAMRPLAAACAMAVIALAFVLKAPDGNPSIASLDAEGIAIERLQVASEDRSGEVRYFKGISPSVSLALTDIIDTSTDYGSADHIKKGIALLSRNN